MMFTTKSAKSGYYLATLAGILAILLWASTIAFSKSVMEQEGYINAAFLIYFYSGILISIILFAFKKRMGLLNGFRNLPVSYYLKIGIFFILNNVLLFLAVGMAGRNEELIIVTLLNYTWPIMVYIIRIPVFKIKLQMGLFIPGILLSFTGISLALLQGYSFTGIGRLMMAGNHNMMAYFLAFLTSVSWALYSNLTVKYESQNDLSGIPVIFFLSSLVFLGIQCLHGQLATIHLSAVALNPDLLFIIAGPTSVGYLGWYFAMKKGNRPLVIALSFFIPIFSLLIMHVKIQLEIQLLFWIAAILLISGSYLCYRSMRYTTSRGIFQEPH